MQTALAGCRFGLRLWPAAAVAVWLGGFHRTAESAEPVQPAAAAAASPAVDFAREIRPILADTCYTCHGPDKAQRSTDLRFDTHDGAFVDLGGYKAIVPGQPAASELIKRITSSDPDERMPPPKSGRQVNARQIELLRRWIAEGAEWKDHWSFLPPRRPAEPEVRLTTWPRNGIDRFVLARLEKQGLAPSEEASKETLIRRVTLDLTGLPPTIAEIDAFLADNSPEAYEKLAERLLASPRYGEHMAAAWLDAARYSDTNGYQTDSTRTMWPWRDWVVEAFNQNLPFDQFTVEQIAGDLLPDATERQKLATGFNRNHPLNGEGGRIPEESRVEYVVDRVDATATVWLGMTAGCGRCHDHKYDPLTQREFYQLYAFFNNISESGGVDKGGNAAPVIAIRQHNKSTIDAMIMQERPDPRKTFVLLRGQWDAPDEKQPVQPDVPACLPPLPKDAPHNRLGLARWLVDPGNPLTARVTVNRFWQQFFGQGLVKTPEDFGSQGEPPTHPQLLDWLATEVIARGWNVKEMHRLIVTSATYRQSSRSTPELLERDPYNQLLARGPRFRISSLALRDQALALSGLLVEKVGGPPVNPYQPDGVWSDFSLGQIKFVRDHGEALYRRSLYTFWRRSVAPTMLFDVASRQVCTVRPSRTNSPLHSLTLLNDITYVEAARQFAARVMKEGGADPASRLNLAMRMATARKALPRETAVLQTALERATKHFRAHPDAAEKLLKVGESPNDKALDPIELAAYTSVMNIVLNLDEVLTKE